MIATRNICSDGIGPQDLRTVLIDVEDELRSHLRLSSPVHFNKDIWNYYK